MTHRIRGPLKVYRCPWCDTQKVIGEMRYPGVTKGKAPTTCHACRVAHPDLSWCDFHGEPHEVSKFAAYAAPRPGYMNMCREGRYIKSQRDRQETRRRCVSCVEHRESWEFRGNRFKALACRGCEELHAGERWCVECEAWLSETQFNRTGLDGAFWAIRCRPCRTAHAHGTTVAEILRIQGVTRPECAACGATGNLKIDHDHACCPAAASSGCCIRGYLCHECNTAEGLLKTPLRALALAAYMEKVAMRERAPGRTTAA